MAGVIHFELRAHCGRDARDPIRRPDRLNA